MDDGRGGGVALLAEDPHSVCLSLSVTRETMLLSAAQTVEIQGESHKERTHWLEQDVCQLTKLVCFGME